MPSIHNSLTQSALDLRSSRDSGFIDTEGHASKFIQILDESMCVVREDISDWLQRYLFSSVNAPCIEPPFLLFRLRSGLWLSRLAYKLHRSVLQSSSDASRAGTTTSPHEFLKGSASHQNLRTLSRKSLPPFPRTLVVCAKLPLGPGDVCSYPETSYSPSDLTSFSSAQSASSSPEHVSSRSGTSSVTTGLSVADRWVARDNVSAFLQWCKDLGIPQTVLFETTGLVHRTEEKNVLLTLMELARIASRFGLDDLPELVRMEREIDLLEAQRASATVLVTKTPTPVPSAGANQSEATMHITSTIAGTPATETSTDKQTVSVKIIRLRKPSADTPTQLDQKPLSGPASGDIVTTQTTVRIAGHYPSKTTNFSVNRTIELEFETGGSTSGNKSGVDYVTDSRGDTTDNLGNDTWCGTSDGSSLSGSICDSASYLSPSDSNDADVAVQTNNNCTKKFNRGLDSGGDAGSGRGPPKHASSGEGPVAVRQPSDPFVAEQVEKKVAQCTCCTRLHLQHLEEGRYRLGTRVYYFRRFRNHVMVRVGGGWLTLDAFLERHDPCRRGGSKSSADSTTVASHSTHPSSLLTVEPLEPGRNLSDIPAIKPSLPLGGSLVDLRRRWSKHSTSSNDSHGSHSSVKSTTSNLITHSRSPRTTSKTSRSTAPPKDVTSIGAHGLSASTRQSKERAASTSRATATKRRVTPSPNSRNRPSGRSTNPPRWR